MGIAENIHKIRSTLPAGVKLVAVSKTKPVELLLEAYDCGQRDFGENKVQEMVAKHQAMSIDSHWHFIGHLQTNKVKLIVPFVHLIHGVDSAKLLKAIDDEAKKINRIVPCLLQFHIAEEETKYGFSIDEACEMLASDWIGKLTHVRISGVMGMATYTDDETQIRKEFASLNGYFNLLKSSYFQDKEHFNEISMGMSGDYLIATEQGSTMVRIGSTIFGERIYSTQSS
jgi:hypothetical protein